MIASLGTGMQADSRTISRKTAASPAEPMKSVATSIIGSTTLSVTEARRRGPIRATSYGLPSRHRKLSSSMSRLNHPVYRNRVLQVAADAVLVALAYFLAFQLRFLDQPHGWPHRYEVLFAQSVGFVVAGKLVVFAGFGLYQKWWRYVSGRDFILILRAVAVASALLVVIFAVAKPFAHQLPRSVEVTDFVLTLILIAGARLAVRLIVERPTRGARMPKHEVLVIGAGSGGQMVVRELQLNPALGANAIGFVDDDARKRGIPMLGLRVLGSTQGVEKVLAAADRAEKTLDEPNPDELVVAVRSAPGTRPARTEADRRDRHIPIRTLP